MRSLTEQLGLEVPDVEEPERFFPPPVIDRLPPTRRLEGEPSWGEVYWDGSDTWQRVHASCLDVIDGLAQGATLEEMGKAMPDYPTERILRSRDKRKLARKYIWRLRNLGYLELPLEEPPEVFAGRYERIREIGRGSMGIAHLCKDRQTGQEVIVKHAWGVLNSIRTGQKATAIEMAILGRLDHPLIPRLVDGFTHRGLLHMVRSYAVGEPLNKAAPPVTDDRSKRLAWATQILDILGHCHEQGFLLLDQAPGNFIARDDGHLEVIDVGVARPLVDGCVRSRAALGTPGYIAPEMRRKEDDGLGARGTVRSDLCNFGRLYAFLCMGQRPQRGWEHDELLAALKDAGVPEEDQKIVSALCRDDPNERPADVAAARQLFA
ncbi:MAG: serine/threonine protein kinase [Thermoplasmatota archaeon]